MTLREFLDSLSEDLNDINPAGTLPRRWSQSQLLRYLNEGHSHVYSLAPHEFMQELLVKLEPGTLQKVCGDFVLHKILGQTDETGLVIRPIPERNQELLTRWTKKVCPVVDQGEFTLDGYTVSPSDAGYFRVYPAVPPNEDVFVKVLGSEPPAPFTAKDLDRELGMSSTVAAAVRQWVLYSALMVDDESAAEMNAAKGHLEVFFQLLNLKITQYQLLVLGVSNKVAKAYASN